MGPAYIALLVATTLAIGAIAIYLIAIIVNLSQVYGLLDVILGVVGEVNEKTEVLAPVIDDIRSELDAGHQVATAVAGRLTARFPPPEEERERAGATAFSGP